MTILQVVLMILSLIALLLEAMSIATIVGGRSYAGRVNILPSFWIEMGICLAIQAAFIVSLTGFELRLI